MDLTKDVERSLITIEEVLGGKTFTWDGQIYNCHAGSLTDSAELVAGGYANSDNKLIIVRKSEFTDGIYPVEKQDIITYNSKELLINAIIEDGTETFFQLVLGTPNKRKN